MYFPNAKNYYKLCHSAIDWVGEPLGVIYQRVLVFCQQKILNKKKFSKKKNFLLTETAQLQWRNFKFLNGEMTIRQPINHFDKLWWFYFF